MKDLIVLAADKHMKQVLDGLLARPPALGIRPIEKVIRVHSKRDPGCARRGVADLSIFAKQYRHGLLMFDHRGSGKEKIDSRKLQKTIDKDLERSPWGGRAKSIVLSPELEMWVWADSPHVADAVGWKNRQPPLRRWLVSQGLLKEGESKPDDPKAAFHAALRETKTPRSAALYRQIAQKVSLQRCTDRAFLDLKALLRVWFPAR